METRKFNNCDNDNQLDSSTLVVALKTCGKNKDLHRGTNLHAEILRRGLLRKNSFIASALISMYAKCGLISKAKEVLEGLHVRDVFTWSALISGYAQMEQGKEALSCYERMRREGFYPDAVTYTCILKACASIKALEKGELIHSEILNGGLLGSNVVLGSALVDMYAKCGALTKAKEVHQALPIRDVISWNGLIAGYVQAEHGKEALFCFDQMLYEGFYPNAVTFICVLKACSGIGALDKGEKIHSKIATQGFLGGNKMLYGTLVDMYVKCGALAKAKELLEMSPCQGSATWNALIAGYAQREHGKEALDCFGQMQWEAIKPNAITYICILKACGSIGALEIGKHIHLEINKQELLSQNIVLGGALVVMYAKSGALAKAKEVLEALPSQNVALWNGLIAGYVQAHQGKEALTCFEQMQREGFFPNAITFVCILKACGIMEALEKGEDIHCEIITHGLLIGNVLLCGALVDMYVKCGALAKAKEVLEGLPIRNVILWNAIIVGCVQKEHYKETLDFFGMLQCEGLIPDAVTFACALKACGGVGALDKGESMRFEIVRQGLLASDIVIGNALVDMYAKCGAVAKAKDVFEGLLTWDVVSWNALIAGYAQGEHSKEALDCFELMQYEGSSPNEVTYLSLLNACTHAGLLDEGWKNFIRMSTNGGIIPVVEHQKCMVRLFSSLGHFDNAVAIIERLPVSSDPLVWLALLSACKTWGNVKLGVQAFQHVV